MKNKLGDKERLGHILDSIDFITKAIEGKTKRIFKQISFYILPLQNGLKTLGKQAIN